jgi:hypothetical protein
LFASTYWLRKSLSLFHISITLSTYKRTQNADTTRRTMDIGMGAGRRVKLYKNNTNHR